MKGKPDEEDHAGHIHGGDHAGHDHGEEEDNKV